MKRVLPLLLVAIAVTASGCSTWHPLKSLTRLSSVLFTGAQMDELPLTGVKMAGCDPLPSLPDVPAGCRMPLAPLPRGERPSYSAVAASLTAPGNESVQMVLCPPAALNDRGSSGPTDEECKKIPVGAVVTISGRPLTGGTTWLPSRLTWKEK